jgi:hypothetical protein
MLKRLHLEPALLITGRSRTLIIADLHLGILSFPDEVIDDAANLAEKVKADSIVIAGDVKHDIGMKARERREVEELIGAFEKAGVNKSEIMVVKGNHDGGIDDIVNTKSSRGIRIGKIGIFHGHAMPSDEVLQAKTLIFAHAHPAIFLRDEVGGIKERVWLEGKIGVEGEEKDVIVMPAFNDLCSSTAVNLEKPAGVFFRRWDYRKAEAMLLDGTLLGKIEML